MTATEGPFEGGDLAERSRRLVRLLYVALTVSTAVYAFLLVRLRSKLSPRNPEHPSGASLFPLFLLLAVALFLGAWLFGRSILRSRRGDAVSRVRMSFVLRAAAAEAIALYGLLVGMLGSTALQAACLFAMSAVAFAACFPGRATWNEAVRRARDGAIAPG